MKGCSETHAIRHTHDRAEGLGLLSIQERQILVADPRVAGKRDEEDGDGTDGGLNAYPRGAGCR